MVSSWDSRVFRPVNEFGLLTKRLAPRLNTSSISRGLVVVALSNTLACGAALAHDIAQASLETADAISSSIHAMQPGASPTEIHHAIKETEEASGSMNRLLTRLRSFLPGNGAAQGKLGES